MFGSPPGKMPKLGKSYSWRLVAGCCFVSGGLLTAHHALPFGIDQWDWMGHDWLGIIIFNLGIPIGLKANRLYRREQAEKQKKKKEEP